MDTLKEMLINIWYITVVLSCLGFVYALLFVKDEYDDKKYQKIRQLRDSSRRRGIR